MKGLWTSSLSLSLGLLVGSAQADDLQWRPTAPASTVAILSGTPASAASPAVTLGRASPLSPAEQGPAPAASLGRPEALANRGAAPEDLQVQPASFSGFAGDQPVFRAKAADSAVHPLPVGGPEKLGMPAEDSSFAISASPPAEGPMPRPLSDTGPPAGPVGIVNGPPGMPGGFCGDVCVPECGPCDGGGCFGADCCLGMCHERSGRVWASAEMLGWWIKDMPAFPLVSASPAGTPRNLAGIPGVNGNTILYGANGINNEDFMGGRFSLGVWLDPCQTIALEGSYLFLGQRTNNFLAGSSGSPILARPFFDALRGVPNAELVAFPNVLAGGVQVSTTSALWGAEANLRWHWYDSCLWGWSYHVDLLGGFRFVELQEGLTVTENLAVPPGAVVPRAFGPASILVMDQFKTDNQFYGGQVGMDTEFHKGPWFLDVNTKLGLGTIHQGVDINGSTTINIPGLSTTSPGGLLAQPTNMGHWARNRFGVMSEMGLKFGYQCTEHLRLFVGYDYLWLNNVVRPTNAIDPVVNPSQLPAVVVPGPLAGPPRPLPIFRESSFWAQGVSCGLEFRY